MDQTTIFLIIAGMALVTAAPRVLPIWLLASRPLPPLLVAWLRYVPMAVLAALLLPMLLLQEKHVSLGFENIFLWAALPAALVAWKRRNLIVTVIVGMAGVALARWLGA